MNSLNRNHSFIHGQQRGKLRTRVVLPLLAGILLLTLACNMPLRGPTPPTDRTPAAETPIASIISAIQNAQAGDVLSLTFTESQLTQLVSAAIQQNQTDIQVENPIVVLRNNQMEVYGRAITEAVSANFQVNLAIQVGDQGQLYSEIISANFGGVPVPDSIRSRLQAALDSALQDALMTAAGRFRVSQAAISDGFLTLNGTVQ